MTKAVEFWFDLCSPAAYLAHTQIRTVATRCDAGVHYRPMLLGSVFQATGNRPPSDVPAKRAWLERDLARWARRYGVPLRPDPLTPVNTLQLMCGAVAAMHEGCVVAYADALFRALWAEGRDVTEVGEWTEVLKEADLDGPKLIGRAQDQPIEDELAALTDEAVRRGVFGAPSFFVGDELFFGQDRMDFVAEALRAA